MCDSTPQRVSDRRDQLMSDGPFRISRRTMLAASGASALVGLSPLVPAVWAQSAGSLQEWIRANAIAVRTIDPRDEDFSDLEPIAAAIGGARVVQLGEPSHGAGSAFSAKVRLVKFLHQRLGFDVLIWESGLYDVALAQAGMRGSDDALAAARRGVFALWTEASQVKPLFEYIKVSQASLRPIEMAGFDMQVTADGSVQRFGLDLRAFTGGLRNRALRNQAELLGSKGTDARARLFKSGFAGRADLDTLAAAARDLRGLIRTRRPDFETAWGTLYTAFMDHTIENMRADALQRFEAAHSGPTTPERENRRDALNAANLRWLLQDKYAGRKAVIWAHDVHVMNAYYSPDFRDVHLRPGPRDMKPTGVFLAEWLREKVYTLGMTAFAGSERMATGGPTTPIAPAPDGSLEARLHTLGHPYAFLNFRVSESRKNPMRSAQVVRMPKFESVRVSDPGRVYDGVFFIDQMAPATRI